MLVAERAGALAVGELVEPDLERGEDEQDEPDLGVRARRRVVVGVLRGAWRVRSHRPVLT